MSVILGRSRVLQSLIVLAFGGLSSASAQVSPAEITNPRLKSLEQTYFSELTEMNQAIARTKFQFPFVLHRVIGLESKDSLSADQRGLEFVMFHGRTILKISGNYNAAFTASSLTENERAGRVLDAIVLPILRLLPAHFHEPINFDGFGFEVSYHVRAKTRSYDYEGREQLTVVFPKADAFRYLAAHEDSERQEILDVSEIYLNGKQFGLVLGARDPLDVDALPKPR
jgi:hypothetical protein